MSTACSPLPVHLAGLVIRVSALRRGAALPLSWSSLPPSQRRAERPAASSGRKGELVRKRVLRGAVLPLLWTATGRRDDPVCAILTTLTGETHETVAVSLP